MKQKKAFKGAISTLLLGVFLMQPAFGFWDTVQTDGIAAFAKKTQASEEITFSAEDFTSHLSTGAKLDGIILQSLPDTNAGILTLDGRTLMEGEGISVSGLERMVFTPEAEQTMASFSFTPVFSTSTDTGSQTVVTLAVGQEDNTPPKAKDVTAETYESIYIEIPLSAEDGEGDAVTYQILDAPKLGTASVVQDKIQYTPNPGKKGLDQFTYVATDAKGESSQPAKVSVQIRKNSAKVTYADMGQNSAYLAALKLSQMDILTGEKVGDSYFFQPDSTVSRNEFVTMTVQAANLDVPKTGVTTFADDEEIVVWAKPYISAAEKAGLISGYLTQSGENVMCGDQAITLAEACVIMENLLDLDTVTPTAVFISSAPVWAQSATAALCEHEILQPDEKGNLNPNESLTKAEAAKLLYASLNYID